LRIALQPRAAEGPEPMLDVIYILSGIAVLGVFALYAIGLRRV
jgi:hypothetical protein